MCQATDKQIIEVLKMETIPALGCTEPVACALACARCKEELGGVPEHIEVFVSGNIYKNGMGVGIRYDRTAYRRCFGCCLWKD